MKLITNLSEKKEAILKMENSMGKINSLVKSKRYSKGERKTIEKSLKFIGGYEEKEFNIEVGKFLIEQNFSVEEIVAGFLQNPPKEYEEKIKKNFGKKILDYLEEQRKVKEIIQKTSKEENDLRRQVIISSVNSVEGIVLEIVSRLIELKKTQDKTLAKELLDFYSSLAERIGMEKIKKIIVNESFKVTNPKKYEEIVKFIKMSEKERENFVKKVISEINLKLKNKVEIVKIKGREKQIYSIYEKIVNRKVPLNKQKDHFAIRIITKKVEDCYKVLELLSEDYKILEGTLKDYIKNPKENGYQSIHFVIIFEKNLVEAQVRTKEMDEFAEEGKAAHWAYKKIKGDQKFEKKTAWLKEILKLKEKGNPGLNEIKLNLFKDKIYCYTPKGKIITLKENSTVLDFAYKIHAEIGNHAIGGVVNGKFVSLKTILQKGDSVEITTSKFQRPRRDWLKFVKTSYAKKIISWEVKKFEKIAVPKVKQNLSTKKEETEKLVILEEFPNHIIDFAKCCNPLPGEPLIGILKSHKRALIHKKGCERIKEAKKYQIEASWKKTFKKPIKIIVEGKDRPGILADLLNTISRTKTKVTEANAKIIGNDMAECFFITHIKTLEKLEELIKRIKKIRGVSKISF